MSAASRTRHRRTDRGAILGLPRRTPNSKSPNILAGVGSVIWLALVAVPLYYLVLTSLRGEDSYLSQGALAWTGLTLGNYGDALRLGFLGYALNSIVVTGATILLVLGLALPAAYAIVRGESRAVRIAFQVILLGLAIPAQAVIVPVYLIITRLNLYDSLVAIILPTAAFSLPIAIIVLTSTLRDVPKELYESMTVDGAGTATIFARLVLPLARPGVITVGIFAGIGAWNGFLFPLVLTQSEELRVLPLGLSTFQSQYTTNVPGLMAAVVLSALPIFALYLFGRRQLLSGLTAGFGK